MDMDMTERVFVGMAIIGTVGFALSLLMIFG
jgi:preprotein translocase subunit Sss1